MVQNNIEPVQRFVPQNRLIRAGVGAARAIAAISQIMNIISMAVLGLITLITVVDVIGRAVFNKPLLGSFEITEFSMAVMVFLSIAWCAVQKGHIQVTILTDKLKTRPKILLSIVTHFISLGIVSIIVWQCILEAIYVSGSGKLSTILNIPVVPFYWIMAIGFLFLGLQILVDLGNFIIEAGKK